MMIMVIAFFCLFFLPLLFFYKIGPASTDGFPLLLFFLLLTYKSFFLSWIFLLIIMMALMARVDERCCWRLVVGGVIMRSSLVELLTLRRSCTRRYTPLLVVIFVHAPSRGRPLLFFFPLNQASFHENKFTFFLI